MLPNDFNWVIIKRIRSEKRVQTNVVGVKLIDIVDMEDFKVGVEDMVSATDIYRKAGGASVEGMADKADTCEWGRHGRSTWLARRATLVWKTWPVV